MTRCSTTTPQTLSDRRSEPQRSSSVAGTNGTMTVPSYCAVLCVTYPGAALLLSKGAPRLRSSCSRSSVPPKTVRHPLLAHHKFAVCGDTIPTHQHFNQLMESIYV